MNHECKWSTLVVTHDLFLKTSCVALEPIVNVCGSICYVLGNTSKYERQPGTLSAQRYIYSVASVIRAGRSIIRVVKFLLIASSMLYCSYYLHYSCC